MSVEVGEKDKGGETLSILNGEVVCNQKTVQNRFKGARNLIVFNSGNKYADNSVRKAAFFECWKRINWKSDIVRYRISVTWR